MNGNSKKEWNLIALALVLILGGSLLANAINTVGGSVDVKDVRWEGSYGTMFRGLLYVPEGVTIENPAPAVLVIGGGDSTSDQFTTWSIELARRGYVVLDFDKLGEGYSEGVAGVKALGYGGPEALRYLQTLDIIDRDNVGMVGHSMGGSAITSAAFAYPDAYKAMFVVGSSTPVMDTEVDPTTLKNFAYICGIEDRCRHDPAGIKRISAIFGTEDLKSIQAGTMYGSVEDGTARMLYYVPYPHNAEYITPGPISLVIDWFQQLVPAPNPITPSNQIWMWKFVGTLIAMIGLVFLLFPLGAILLRTPFFNSLVQSIPEFKGLQGKSWWIGAIITAAIPVLSLFYIESQAVKLLPPTELWPMNRVSGIMGWAVFIGVVTIILLLVNRFLLKGDHNATAYNYGLTNKDGGIEWSHIGKSLLLAFCLFGIGILVLAVVYWWLLVDFRFWTVSLRVLTPMRFRIMLQYVIPWMFFFIVFGANLHGLLRPKAGSTSLGREILINILMLAPWFYLWFPAYFGPLYTGVPEFFAGGQMKDWFWMFPTVMIAVVFISTYFYRKTGRVYVGAFLNALLISWSLVGGNMIQVAF
jgi:pimeloyl-ACP methyl ester carboxylesterase